MVRKWLSHGTLVLVSLIAFTLGCRPEAKPDKELPVPTAPLPVSSKQAWETEWDRLVAAAQKEGSVMIYTTLRPKARDAVTAAFKAKYGLDVEWIAGRTAELVAKIKAERTARLNLVDLSFMGSSTFLFQLKPLEIAPPLEPLFVLPEVKDPKSWLNGEHPFLDKEKMGFAVLMVASKPYIMNSDMVREGEIKSSADLLNAKWKEKIVLSDPSISGAGSNWFSWTLRGVMGEEKGLQFMRALAAQKPLITRDERLLVEWVARGKYPLGIGASTAVTAEFVQVGTPVSIIDFKEPSPLGPGSGVLNAFTNAPHPQALQLFVNWVLSKEGSAVFAPASEYPSTRVDVPPVGILPLLVPRAGDIYPEAKFEGYEKWKADMQKVAAEIFLPSK